METSDHGRAHRQRENWLRRVSTQDQKLDLQRNALTAAGCAEIFEDQTSGTQTTRPGLDKVLAKIGPGVVLIVWRLDRLGRSLSHLVEVVQQIEAKGGGFVSLTENIDTTSAGGRLVFHMMAALAEFERALIVPSIHLPPARPPLMR